MGSDLHAVLEDAVPNMRTLTDRRPRADDRGGDLRFVVHAHALQERRVHDRCATHLAGLAEDHVRSEPTFDEGPRPDVDGGAQAPRGHVRLGCDPRTARGEEEVLSVQVIRQGPRVRPPTFEPMRYEALRNQPRENLAFHGHGAAALDEVEHGGLEHVAPGVHQMARGLALRGFLDEPRDPAFFDLDGAEGGRIVHGPYGDRPNSVALPVGLNEGVEVDRIDDVTVVHGERTAEVPLHVLQRATGAEWGRLVDDADRDAGFVFPEKVANLVEQVIHGNDRLVAR